MTKKSVLSRVRLRWRLVAGCVFNLAGIPGLVKNCDYNAAICKGKISVKVKQLYTIITVNGLDIYFHRLTGSIDGVGIAWTDEEATNFGKLAAQTQPEPTEDLIRAMSKKRAGEKP